MVDFDLFKRKLVPFEILKRKSGRSCENPPNGSKTAGSYAQPSFPLSPGKSLFSPC